jgi:Raf kinase inhibitor-like YbhB/YbcL family protein
MRRKTPGRVTLARCAVIVTTLGTLAACSTDDGREMKPPTDAQIAASQTTAPSSTTTAGASVDTSAVEPTTDDSGSDVVMTLSAPWADDATVTEPYKCGVAKDSPALTWVNVPADAKALAVVLLDEDKPDVVHWVVANIAPDATGLPAGVVDSASNDVIQATNERGEIGYFGPCPPEGETHEYSLTLYALDQMLELPDGTNGLDLQDAVYAAALEAAAVTFSA